MTGGVDHAKRDHDLRRGERNRGEVRGRAPRPFDSLGAGKLRNQVMRGATPPALFLLRSGKSGLNAV